MKTSASAVGPYSRPPAMMFPPCRCNGVIREVAFPGPRLVLNNVSGANAGAYDVVVSSPDGTVTSSVVTLQVRLPLSIVLSGPNTAVLSWPASGNAFTLQQTGNLASP